MTGKDTCEAWGGCPLPRGHNLGKADTPANHHSQTPCPDPDVPCGYLDGMPCDFHGTEIDHAHGNHEHCPLTCEDAFPSEMLRNGILYSAIPGSKNMLKELERRAEQRSPRAALMRAHAVLVDRNIALEQRARELEAELRIGTPWKCPVCSKENDRDACLLCDTYRPDPEDTP
jgi:hypothetical protein